MLDDPVVPRPDNAASIRVAEKIGMRPERTTEWAGLPHLFAVSKVNRKTPSGHKDRTGLS
jgi:hypothetical protein